MTQACIKTCPLHDYNVEYYLYSYFCPDRRRGKTGFLHNQPNGFLNGFNVLLSKSTTLWPYILRRHIYIYIYIDRLCGLVVRVLGYTTEMYCASCEVRTECKCYVEESRPPLWSSGNITEMYCTSCEVRTKFIYVI
jgi:hypothetical protein